MSDWPDCKPKSASLLGKIVASPNGGWQITNDPASTPAATLKESSTGGLTVDPTKKGTGVVELQDTGPAKGFLDPERSVSLELDYSPLLEPEWSDC